MSVSLDRPRVIANVTTSTRLARIGSCVSRKLQFNAVYAAIAQAVKHAMHHLTILEEDNESFSFFLHSTS